MELRNKGINKEIIDQVLEEVPIDENKLALEVLMKREIHWGNVPDEKRRQKMLEYLVRKGFSFSIAEKAIKEYNMRHV